MKQVEKRSALKEETLQTAVLSAVAWPTSTPRSLETRLTIRMESDASYTDKFMRTYIIQ